MLYDIFKTIPHKRVTSSELNAPEVFDLYQCGIFNHKQSQKNIELVELYPKIRYRSHYHKNSSAVIYIITGQGYFVLGHQQHAYSNGSCFDVPAKKLHGFHTQTHTLFLSIQSPPIIDPLDGSIDLYYESN